MAMGDDDKAEGTFDKLKGKAKKVYGEITDDREKKAEGSLDKAKGSFKETKGDIKNALDTDRDPDEVP